MPQVPEGMVSRGRLTAILDELAPVTIIRSLQGTGKTTLVCDWIRTTHHAITPVWISLSADLADRATISFVLEQHLLATGVLDSRMPDGMPLLARLDVLLAMRSPAASNHVVIVLDNADHLIDRAFAEDLVSVATRFPRVSLIACARGPHVIEAIAPWARMIQMQDLRFSDDEARQLATSFEPSVDPDLATGLHGSVGGWAAPLRLLLQAAAAGQATEGVTEQWMRTLVVMSPGAQHAFDWMLLFSLAERLDKRLLDDFAAQDPSVGAFAVDLIERPGLIERRLVGGRAVYEFPPVVLRYLRERMEADRAGSAAFHRRLSSWYRAQPGGVDATLAFWHAVAGEDYSSAYEIWAEHSPRMTMTDPALYLRGLERLPEALLRQHPGMRVALAASRAAIEDDDPIGRDTTFRALSAAADRVLLIEGDDLPLPDLLSVGAGHLLGLRRSGQIDRARDYAGTLTPRIEALLKDADTVPVGMLAWTKIQIGLTSTVAGDYPDAIRRCEEAWVLESGGHRTYISVAAAANLAMIHAFLGDTRSARAWLRRHERMVAISGLTDGIASAGADIAVGLLALDGGDHAAYHCAASRLAGASNQHDVWIFVLHLHAQSGLRMGDPLRALAALDRSVRGRGEDVAVEVFAHPVIVRARADLLLAGNRPHLAREAIKGEVGPDLIVPHARYLCLTGRVQQAAHLVRTADVACISPRDQLELMLVEVSAASRSGDAGNAERLLHMVRDLAATIGVAEPLAALPAEDRATLQLHTPVPPIYPDRLDPIDLTRRERELLDILLVTDSRKEAAERLFVSMNTVKTHLASLYRKLGARTQSEAIEIAQRRGLLPDPATRLEVPMDENENSHSAITSMQPAQ